MKKETNGIGNGNGIANGSGIGNGIGNGNGNGKGNGKGKLNLEMESQPQRLALTMGFKCLL